MTDRTDATGTVIAFPSTARRAATARKRQQTAHQRVLAEDAALAAEIGRAHQIAARALGILEIDADQTDTGRDVVRRVLFERLARDMAASGDDPAALLRELGLRRA